jgi:hypothetical protein
LSVIEEGTRFLSEVIADFCAQASFPPPRKVALYSIGQFREKVGAGYVAAYNDRTGELAMSEGIQTSPSLIVHELAHHFQALRDGPDNFHARYDEYLGSYGYESNPYQVEAKELERKWWPQFKALLEGRLKES